MMRLQIQMPEDQAASLAETARSLGVSQAQVVREALADWLSERRRPSRYRTVKEARVAQKLQGMEGIPDSDQGFIESLET